MPDINEMMGDLQQADAAGDTQLAQHIAGLIKSQQHGAIEGEPDLGGVGNAALAAGIHFVHQLPFIGDAAITAGRGINDLTQGRGFDLQRANDEAHQTIASASQQHPIASAVGGGLGAVDTAVVGGGALKMAGLMPAALELKAGQTAANVGRLALGGAAAGGLQGGAEGGGEALAGGHLDQVPGATAKGALGGAVAGAVVGPVAGGGTAIARRVFSALDTKTAMALARVFGESPSDLQAAFQTFKTTVGRSPTMAELASMKQAGQLKGAAKDSSTITQALTQAQGDMAQARSANMQGVIAPTPPTAPPGQTALPVAPGAQGTSSGEIANATTQQGDVDYGAARAHSFQIPTEESDALGGVSPADHLASQVLPLAGLKTADKVRIMSDLKDGTLSGQDAQLLRSRLSAAQGQGSNYSPAISSAQGDLDDILQSPGNDDAHAALANANANYTAGAQRAAGAAHGETVLGAQTAPNFAAEATSKPNANPNFTAGLATGARSKLADAAATPQGATSLAARFATDDSLHAKVSGIFGKPVADSLRLLGQQETQAAQNLAPYANRVSTDDGDTKAANTALRSLAAFASHGVYQFYHGYKAIQGLGMSEAVQAKVAQYLSDPKMTQQGIALLQKAGMTNSQLRQMALTAAANVGAIGGSAGAAAADGTQESPQ